MSMLTPSAAAHAGSSYMGTGMDMGLGVNHHLTMTAPNTAMPDHSFHTIMISDGSQPIGVAAAAAVQAHQGIPMRQKRGPASDDDAAAGAYDGLLSSSLPSGSPRANGGFGGLHGRAGPEHPAPYPPIAYPPLSAAIARGDSGPGLSPSFPPVPLHARTASHHSTPRLQDVSGPAAGAALPYSVLAGQMAMASSSQRNSASDISLPDEHYKQQQQQQQQAPGPVYHTLAMDSRAAGGLGAAQLYPVSQPGLPPAGPASASLSAYAVGGRSPMVARGRGRRKPYYMGDYPDTEPAVHLSPGEPPALATGAASASALLSLPAMRQTHSNIDAAAALGYGSAGDRWDPMSQRPADLRVSTAQLLGLGGPNFSSASAAIAAGQMLGAAAGPASARTGVYSYPEVTYGPGGAALPGQDRPGMMMDASGASDCDPADGTDPSSLHSVSANDVWRNAGSRASLRPEATPESGPQYPEQTAIPASMAHMRWNPASGNSPLRAEIGTAAPNSNNSGHSSSGLAHIYGTISRAQAAAGSASGTYGQPATAAADMQGASQRP
ncbi:hypothetical protein IWQ57_004066, partial [Coemansia nantahalensis]